MPSPYTVPGVWQDDAMKPPKWLAAQQAAERASKKKRAAAVGNYFADMLKQQRLAREQAKGRGDCGKSR